MKKQKIIIDTDPGKDDVLAILYALFSPSLDIQAITTVAGNTTIQNATNNARFVLDIAQSNTPLFSGSIAPMKGKLKQGVVMGNGGLEGIEKVPFEGLNNGAIDKLIEIIRKNPKAITILAIGPLTNIAQAFKRDPSLPSLVQSIVMMGGTIQSPGNTNRVSEFNFYTDPEAAALVFQCQVPKVLIPLDVCYKVPLFEADFKKLQGSRVYAPIMKMMPSYIQYLSQEEGQVGAIVYDALASYYLTNPESFVTEPMDIQIETTGNKTRGMCVVERRKYKKRNLNVLVAMDVDVDMFKRDFLRTLKQG